MEPVAVVGTGVVDKSNPSGEYSRRAIVCVLAVDSAAPVPPRKTMREEEGKRFARTGLLVAVCAEVRAARHVSSARARATDTCRSMVVWCAIGGWVGAVFEMGWGWCAIGG